MIVAGNKEDWTRVADAGKEKFQELTFVDDISELLIANFELPIVPSLNRFRVEHVNEPICVTSKAGRFFLFHKLQSGTDPYLCENVIESFWGCDRYNDDIIIPEQNPLEKKIEELKEIDRPGLYDRAMSSLNNFILDIYLTENIKEVDFFMEYFLKENYSIHLLISFARISKPYKDRLSNRPSLIKELEAKLIAERSEIEVKNILLRVS